MRKGERYRKSVRGCIISHNTSVLHLVIVKKGPEELPGLTDSLIPRRLGPKRASKIRKLFALTKDDDVRKYVIRREVPAKSEDKKPSSKAPKIQRLVTPISLQRKRHRMSAKKNRQLKAKTVRARRHDPPRPRDPPPPVARCLSELLLPCGVRRVRRRRPSTRSCVRSARRSRARSATRSSRSASRSVRARRRIRQRGTRSPLHGGRAAEARGERQSAAVSAPPDPGRLPS